MSEPAGVVELSLAEAYEYAQALVEAQELDGAEAVCAQLLARRPNDVRAHGLMGEVSYGQGRLEHARTHFGHVLQRDPQDANAHVAAALIAESAGDGDTAATEYAAGAYLDPAIPQIRERLAELSGSPVPYLDIPALPRLYLESGDALGALAEVRLLQGPERSRPWARLALLEALWRAGRTPEAGALAEELTRSLPGALRPVLVLAWGQWEDGDEAAAEATLAGLRDADPGGEWIALHADAAPFGWETPRWDARAGFEMRAMPEPAEQAASDVSAGFDPDAAERAALALLDDEHRALYEGLREPSQPYADEDQSLVAPEPEEALPAAPLGEEPIRLPFAEAKPPALADEPDGLEEGLLVLPVMPIGSDDALSAPGEGGTGEEMISLSGFGDAYSADDALEAGAEGEQLIVLPSFADAPSAVGEQLDEDRIVIPRFSDAAGASTTDRADDEGVGLVALHGLGDALDESSDPADVIGAALVIGEQGDEQVQLSGWWTSEEGDEGELGQLLAGTLTGEESIQTPIILPTEPDPSSPATPEAPMLPETPDTSPELPEPPTGPDIEPPAPQPEIQPGYTPGPEIPDLPATPSPEIPSIPPAGPSIDPGGTVPAPIGRASSSFVFQGTTLLERAGELDGAGYGADAMELYAQSLRAGEIAAPELLERVAPLAGSLMGVPSYHQLLGDLYRTTGLMRRAMREYQLALQARGRKG